MAFQTAKYRAVRTRKKGVFRYRALPGQDRIGLDDLVVGPLVKIVEAQKQRQIQQGQDRQHPRSRCRKYAV